MNNNEDQSKFMVTRNQKKWVGALMSPPHPPDPSNLGTFIQFLFSEVISYLERSVNGKFGGRKLRQLSCMNKSSIEGDFLVTVT